MTIRTTKKTVTFANPFTFSDFDEVLPAGAYEVETDEELLDGLSFPAYRRTLALIRLPAKSGHPGLLRTLTLDPNELDAALERDEASRDTSPEVEPHQKPPEGIPAMLEVEADCRALDSAEAEGMIVHAKPDQ